MSMQVSIVVPCYNAVGKIERCISSLNNIDYPKDNYEVVFRDDCSTDGTFEYLENITSFNQNWRLCRTKSNTGSPSEPRNIGIRNSEGEFVFFLDCDDEILPDTLSKHIDTAQLNEADIVRGYLIVETGLKRYNANRLNESVNSLSHNEKIKKIIQKQSTTVPSLIRKTMLIKNDIKWDSNIRMGEDTLFLIEALTVCKKIVYIDHPTFIYNKVISDKASSTQKYGSRELNNHIYVWERSQELLAKVKLNYLKTRLQVGLQTAINSIINFNGYDITHSDFERFSEFCKKNQRLIKNFNYSKRIREIIDIVLAGNYNDFLEMTKPRLVIAGYDLKFINSAVPSLQEFFQIRIDSWKGHAAHDEEYSIECLMWADVIFCEWMLGKPVWYSQRVSERQKLIIRMHRFELTTKWYKEIDFSKVNRVIAVSLYFFFYLLEYTKIPREMAYLMPNYLDTLNYKNSNSNKKLFNIGIIGILPSRKGYYEALQIINELVKHDKRYCLYVYGKMPEDLNWVRNNQAEMAYYNKCYEFINKNNLQNHVVLKGWVNIKEDIKDIGFVLSTSESDEIPESFHIAPSDAFAASNQGLLLNWNGVEYIYPKKYIFDSVEKIVYHILSQGSLKKFNQFKREGCELVNRRYSLSKFVENFKHCVKVSDARTLEKRTQQVSDRLDTKISSMVSIYNQENNVVLKDKIAIKIPIPYQSGSSLMVKYEIDVMSQPKTNLALLSLKIEGANSIKSFILSDFKEIGLYKYLSTDCSTIRDSISIEVPHTAKLEYIYFRLWNPDAKVVIKSIDILSWKR